jgi:peroxiredoxin
MDTATEALIRRATEYLRNADSMFVEIDAVVTSGSGEQARRSTNSLQIIARRPNFYARTLNAGGELHESRVSDGKTISWYMRELEAYDSLPAAPTIDALLMNDRLADNTIASALFTNDGFERLTESFLTARIAGERSDRGTTCTVVQVTEENGTSELLIRNGEEPLIQTFTHRGEKSSVTMTFLKWEVNKPIPEELFKFIPPADAQKISSVEDELRRLSGDDYPALKLLGAAPPPFELPALGGDTVSLSKHLGKNIIVLDFWATWCPPCRAALPGLVEVTDSLADKGVVFYAINLRENEGVVRDFMKKQKKQFLVLMDNGDVAAAYKVEPIPQTVIIGANGTVQAVHFGFTNRQLIRRELDMLLTGRNLVEPQK